MKNLNVKFMIPVTGSFGSRFDGVLAGWAGESRRSEVSVTMGRPVRLADARWEDTAVTMEQFMDETGAGPDCEVCMDAVLTCADSVTDDDINDIPHGEFGLGYEMCEAHGGLYYLVAGNEVKVTAA